MSRTIFLSDFIKVRNEFAQAVGPAHTQWIADLERTPLLLSDSGERYSVMPADPNVGATASGRTPERALRGLLFVLLAMHTQQDSIASLLNPGALRAAQRQR